MPPDICYHDKVGIRSFSEERYLSIEKPGDEAVQESKQYEVCVRDNHPFPTRNSFRLDGASAWTILLSSNREHVGPVRCGDTVCIAKGPIPDMKRCRGAFLSNSASSKIPMVEIAAYEIKNPSMTWTLVDATDHTSTASISSSPCLLLRDQFHNYIGARPQGGLKMEERDMKKSNTRWEILRADIPRIASLPRPIRFDAPYNDDISPSSRGQVRYREVALCDLPLSHQEALLVEDLLFCMGGSEGVYIKLGHGTAGPEFTYPLSAQEGVDRALAGMVAPFLPLCNDFLRVKTVIQEQSHLAMGWVNQALCSALSVLLREHQVLIAQLESTFREGDLTLSSLKYYVQPIFSAMRYLRNLVDKVAGKKGGKVLNAIDAVNERYGLGFQELSQFLLQKAAEPYFVMITKWLHEGEISDANQEFFVKENTNYSMDHGTDYWYKRYAIVPDQVPFFFSSIKDKILHTGKHLNVLTSLKDKVNYDLDESDIPTKPLRFSSRNERDYAEAVDSCHDRASQRLLKLFFSPPFDLKSTLGTWRNFFLLGKADFYTYFMDQAYPELKKDLRLVNLPRVSSLLQLAIRSSSNFIDPNSDDIECTFQNFSIKDAATILSGVGTQVKGTNAEQQMGEKSLRFFTLKYKIAYPMNLIFTRTVHLKYQLIFRHLLYCRHVERLLVEVWTIHLSAKGIDNLGFRQPFATRMVMMHTCRNYIFYATMEVLEPRYQEMMAKMNTCQTLDDVIKVHDGFLDTCLRELLIFGKPALYDKLNHLLVTCDRFAQSISVLYEGGVISDKTRNNPIPSEHGGDRQQMSRATLDGKARIELLMALLNKESYSALIIKYEDDIAKALGTFLVDLEEEASLRTTDHVHLTSLLTRLNYNDWFTEKMNLEKQQREADRAAAAAEAQAQKEDEENEQDIRSERGDHAGSTSMSRESYYRKGHRTPRTPPPSGGGGGGGGGGGEYTVSRENGFPGKSLPPSGKERDNERAHRRRRDYETESTKRTPRDA